MKKLALLVNVLFVCALLLPVLGYGQQEEKKTSKTEKMTPIASVKPSVLDRARLAALAARTVPSLPEAVAESLRNEFSQRKAVCVELGVAPSSSLDEINQAFKKALVQHHPDNLAARATDEERQVAAKYVELLKKTQKWLVGANAFASTAYSTLGLDQQQLYSQDEINESYLKVRTPLVEELEETAQDTLVKKIDLLERAYNLVSLDQEVRQTKK